MAGPHAARGHRPRPQAECGPVGRVCGVCLAGRPLASSEVGNRSTDRSISHTIRKMTLREKVGQLFVANVYGESAARRAQMTSRPTRRCTAPGSPTRSISSTRTSSAGSSTSAGRTISTRRSRSRACPTAFSGPRSINRRAYRCSSRPTRSTAVCACGPRRPVPGQHGARRDTPTGRAFSAAKVTARELAALGINQNYAPDADVNINPLNPVIGVRSFGESPDSYRT